MALFPFRALMISWALHLYFALAREISPHALNLQDHLPTWLQIIIFLLCTDFAIYVLHRWQHRYGFYWKWHKVHHAGTELTASTSFRTNVFELAFVQFGSRILISAFLGLSAGALFWSFAAIITVSGALNHANLDFPRGRWKWLNYVFVTPNLHALHHSRLAEGYNYGETFSVFDLLFGTFKMPLEKPGEFGLNDPEFSHLGLWAQQFHPILSKRRDSTN
jgi:sterol desaturase/sphingolipid hydroxylase (fatty acid hydroxylase superfamily)